MSDAMLSANIASPIVSDELKVSILMSVYNGEPFLGEAVKSILEQTHKKYEFIIVNDGSTDKSLNILKKLSDPRVKIFSQKNQGLASALNFGLSNCANEIVVRMDADDVAKPERIECLLSDWLKRGQPDVFGSCADYIDSNGRFLWSVDVPTENDEIKKEILNASGMPLIHPSVLFGKSAVMKSGGYDPYFSKNSQDYDLWLKMTDKNFKFGNSQKKLLQYRFQEHSNTALSVKNENQFSYDTINLGSWCRLLALQKRLLYSFGMSGCWEKHNDDIRKILFARFKQTDFIEESLVNRQLTELKVRFYGGRKITSLCKACGLFFREPTRVMNRILKKHHHNTKLSDLLILPEVLSSACCQDK